MTPLTRAAINGAIEIGKSFTHADESWEPTLLIQTNVGAAPIPVAPFFEDDYRRELFANQVLPQLIEDANIVEITLVTEVWVGAERDDDDTSEVERPTQENHAKEAVLVSSVNAERIEHHVAFITRNEHGPPLLGDFERPAVYPYGLTEQVVHRAFEALRAKKIEQP